jgi:hypothetical protein
MAKHSTFPILFDETLKINLSILKRWGYLKPNQTVETTLIWSRHGEKIAEVGLFVCMLESNPYVRLNYSYQGEPREFKLKLFWKESNLNQGKVWFFICPKTFKYCRKLYLVDGYFLSRAAFRGLNCMYEKQTYSKYGRSLDKIFGTYYGTERAYEKIHSKNFKKYYAGKPTKKYLKLLEIARKSEAIQLQKVESIIFKNKD